MIKTGLARCAACFSSSALVLLAGNPAAAAASGIAEQARASIRITVSVVARFSIDDSAPKPDIGVGAARIRAGAPGVRFDVVRPARPAAADSSRREFEDDRLVIIVPD